MTAAAALIHVPIVTDHKLLGIAHTTEKNWQSQRIQTAFLASVLAH